MWPVKRRVPEQRADSRQQAAQRAGVHRDVDIVFDHYSNIAFEADGRAWPANLRQDMPRGRGELTSVEAAAEHSIFGRAERRLHGQTSTSDWLAGVKEHVAGFVNMAAQAMTLDPPKAKRVGRVNSVEVCVECKLPITEVQQQGKPAVRRINGQPLHATSCYYRVRRAKL